MSAGNACAAIGLANTSKIPMIGGYLQDATLPGPGANGPHIGVQAEDYWSSNWLGEEVDPAFTVPATSGAAAGKLAHWVTTGSSPMTVAADGKCSVTAGVVTATATTGLYKTYVPAGTVVPAGSFLWVFVI